MIAPIAEVGGEAVFFDFYAGELVAIVALLCFCGFANDSHAGIVCRVAISLYIVTLYAPFMLYVDYRVYTMGAK